MKLTERQWQLLEGLRDGGNLYLPASEVADAQVLANRGFVKIWHTVGGFPGWALTDVGRQALKEKSRGSA